MYKVTIKNGGIEKTIHHHTFNDLKLQSGQIKQGINVADSFSFTILPKNPGYSLIRPLSTLITVLNTRTGKTEFDGRILMPTESMSEDGSFAKSFICESELGYLNDSCQRYGTYQNLTVRQFLEIIVSNHNNDVDGDEIDKKFVVGNVTVSDNNNVLSLELGYEQTFDAIESNLINKLGGELVVRKENGVRYLDYLTVAGEVKTTEIRLARNLKSIQKETDPNDTITKLVPLGKDRLTVASVNNGKDFIIDEITKAEFGIQTKSITWDDITDPAILLSMGQSYLQENNRLKFKYSITALDLSIIGLDTDAFEKGNYYPVINPIMGINETLRVIEKITNIIHPNDNSLTVGDLFKTMSQYQYESNKAAQEVVQLRNTISSQSQTISTLTEGLNTVNQSVMSLNETIESGDLPGINTAIGELNQAIADLNTALENIPIYGLATSTTDGLMPMGDKGKLDLITLLDAIDLDELKTKLDLITIANPVDLDTIDSRITALEEGGTT